MKVAVFGKNIAEAALPHVTHLLVLLEKNNIKTLLYKELIEAVPTESMEGSFENHEDLIRYHPDFLISLGGDGTILDAVSLVKDTGIPILGINLGRLGFLANVAKEDISRAIDDLVMRRFSISQRNLIHMDVLSDGQPIAQPFALNEISVSRKDTTAMITIHAYINDVYLNSYWADGLIVSTPTGSTGYSLSCGGPIIMPDSESFVITPIAPHNLNVRPFVIPNHYQIRLKVESRESEFLASADSRIYKLPTSTELVLQKEQFLINMVQTYQQDFAATLRKKLLWGLDRRN